MKELEKVGLKQDRISVQTHSEDFLLNSDQLSTMNMII